MKKVVWAAFHEVLFYPGIGHLGHTLPSQGKTMDLDMWHSDAGLAIRLKYQGKPIEGMIPWANVKNVQYAPEGPSTTSVRQAA